MSKKLVGLITCILVITPVFSFVTAQHNSNMIQYSEDQLDYDDTINDYGNCLPCSPECWSEAFAYPNPCYVGEVVTLVGNGGCRDPSEKVWGWILHDKTWKVDYWINNITYSKPGKYLEVFVVDNTIVHDYTSIFVWVNARPPVANFIYYPFNPTTQDLIQFTDTSTEGSGAIVSWYWNFSDGSTSSVQNPIYQYKNTGSYTVNLTVIDNNSEVDTKTQTLNIQENQPPSAVKITGPPSGKAGEECTFTVFSTDPEEHDVLYFVEWGDGTYEDWSNPYPSGTEVIFYHTWSEQGTYTMRVRAKDRYNAVGEWTVLVVTMPRITPKYYRYLLNFLEKINIFLPLNI